MYTLCFIFFNITMDEEVGSFRLYFRVLILEIIKKLIV